MSSFRGPRRTSLFIRAIVARLVSIALSPDQPGYGARNNHHGLQGVDSGLQPNSSFCKCPVLSRTSPVQ